MTLAEDWTTIPEGNAAERYASFIHRRTVDGMIINDWPVDWVRAPLTQTVYPSSVTHMMPLPGARSDIFAETAAATPSALADALHVATGIVSQRLTVNLNDRPPTYTEAASAKWGRTTASGGGRYCADTYLVESGRELPPGIYHYSILHHAWELIASGDHTDAVALAQGYGRTAERYLLTTINYWRSGFKYNDFAYQATAMDIGTVAASVTEILGPGLAGSWDMWVSETKLAALLGLDPEDDGVYAVQAWGRTRPVREAPAGPSSWPERLTSSFTNPPTRFLTTTALQRDMADFLERPDGFPEPSTVESINVIGRREDWLDSLVNRESSFGRFTGAPIPVGDLMAILGRASEAGTWMMNGSGCLRWEFLIYVESVDGLAPGLYTYSNGEMMVLSAERQNKFLPTTYFLKNYDGHRAAATIVLCANVFQVARAWGVRGYRLVNAVVGAMCQAISVDATRHGIGTGTALGFDTLRHARHAGLDAERMCPMLLIMTGVDDALCGRYRATTTSLEDPS